MKRVERPGVREGYDLWSKRYDGTPNPVVALDRRVTPGLLAARPDEYVLDAGCGTGWHLAAIRATGTRALGVDFSRAMLRVARQRAPDVALVVADLEEELPLPDEDFDAALCALVGEHLRDLPAFFRSAFAVLKPGGRLVFSVFHPALAQAGIEANFEDAGVEYRLGAERHSVDDYRSAMTGAGFRRIAWQEFNGDEQLVEAVPAAVKYLRRPVLLVLRGRRES